MKLSKDEEKVYYSITIKRDGTPVLEYGGVNGEDNKLKVTNSGFQYGNNLQAFYFTKGTTAPQVLIHTKSNDYILTARIVNSTSDLAQGAGKVAGVEPTTDESTLSSKEWIIEANTSSGWYNIRPIPLDGSTTNLYMSNIYGVGNNIGFYTNANDGGSCFQFTEQTVWDKSEAFYQLYNYYTHSVKVNEIIESQYMNDDLVGYYSVDKANEYNNAYFTAGFAINSVLNGSTSFTDENFTTAYNALVTANDALTFNLPEVGKYYVLRSACTQANYCTDALAYVDPANPTQRIYWSKGKEVTDATAIWTITPNGDGTFAVRNLHTGTAVSKFNERLTDAAGSVSLTLLDYKTGELKLTAGGTIMHAQQTGSIIVSWNADKGSASAWNIEEVTDLSEVGYALNMSQYEQASLYLAYPAIIPNGITAYYATVENADITDVATGGKITLTPIAGNVLPAETGVILRGAQGAYNFNLSTEEGSAPDGNLFMGSPYKKLVQGVANYKYYLFGARTMGDGSKKVGLFMTWLEYLADGTTSYTRDTGKTDDQGHAITENVSTAGTDNGGYFYVSANKIYMPWKTANGAAPAFYFNFDGTTTGVDGIENVWDRNTGIYDLQGRRVNRIEQSGIYVINGQKRFVKVNGR